MPTYKQIQERVRAQTGRTPKNCWIAHVKDDEGLTTRTAPNRRSQSERRYPCPEHMRQPILNALRSN